MPKKRCGPGCDSYISGKECNDDFETTRPIQEGDLCHYQYSINEITKDRKLRKSKHTDLTHKALEESAKRSNAGHPFS